MAGQWAAHLLQSRLIVLAQLNSLPHACGLVGTLDSLHVEIGYTVVFPDSGIAAVGQWTRLPAAQPRHVVLIAAERVLSSPETPRDRKR